MSSGNWGVGMEKLRGRFLSSDSKGLTLWRQSEYRFISGEHFEIHGKLTPAQGLASILNEGDLIEITGSKVRILVHCQRPWSPPKVSDQTLRNWTQFHQQVRDFFIKQDFLEILTPSLVACPGSEPTLDVFQIQDSNLYLPTSPEWHLKKALVKGYEQIFEIKNSFRKNESSQKHRPEFLMLEWYRSYEVLERIQTDVISLIQNLAAQNQRKGPVAIEKWTVQELFQKYLEFRLSPETTEEELRSLALKHQIDLRSAASIDDVFFLLFIEKIENQFDEEKLIFVSDYPPYQAALAQISEQGWGQRFEAYWKGFELCNAFYELNDPQIQRLRFAEDQEKKISLSKKPVGTDEEFFHALEQGMPPSSGIALGLERLFMALYDLKDFKNLRVF